MQNYLNLLNDILEHGTERKDRTGVGTKALFATRLEFDLRDGFPAVTTKKLAFKNVAAELLWFIKGSSDTKLLNELGSHIWDANANADYWKPKARFDGDAGRIYGVQWRSWRKLDGTTIDQLKEVIERIKKNPTDRRLLVSAWNPGELDEMSLPPCHVMFQFFVDNGTLSLQMYQRSADMFLGVPFNIASYALLLAMVAQVTDLKPARLIIVLGDTHIYLNHKEQVKEQLVRKPYSLPKLWLNAKVRAIDEFSMEDIKLEGYKFHPPIKAEMAV